MRYAIRTRESNVDPWETVETTDDYERALAICRHYYVTHGAWNCSVLDTVTGKVS